MSNRPTISLAAFTLAPRLAGDALVTTCRSGDGARTYRQEIPIDPARRVTCSCWGNRKYSHCYHADSAALLGERFRETCEVQSGLAPESLRQQADWLSPQAVGAVSIAYLVSRYLLDKRAEEARAA